MIGIYARVSTAQQDKRNAQGHRDKAGSLEQQLTKGIAFAERISEPYQSYVEQGSGKSVGGRHDFSRLIKDIQEGRITKVWCRHIDRTSRDVHDGSDFLKQLETYKVKLFEGDGGKEYDLSDADDVMRVQLEYVFGERERKKITERVLNSKAAIKDAGKRVFCYVYGYEFLHDEKTGKKYPSIVPQEAEIVRVIYEHYEKGQSFVEIARYLNEHGFKPKKSGWIVKEGKDKGKERNPQFEQTTISKILHRPEYIGLTENTKGELIKSVYPPLFTAPEALARWHSIQETIDQKATARSKKTFKDAGNLITGLIRCPICGSGYFYHKATKRHGKDVEYCTYMHKAFTETQRACTNAPKNLLAPQIERIVEQAYVQLVYNKADYAKFVENQKGKILASIEAINQAIERLNLDMDEIKSKKKNLIEAVANGALKGEDIKEKSIELDSTMERLITLISERTREKTILESQEDEALVKLQTEEVEYYQSLPLRNKRSILGSRLTCEIRQGKLTITSLLGSMITVDVDKFAKKCAEYAGSQIRDFANLDLVNLDYITGFGQDIGTWFIKEYGKKTEA